MLKRVTKVTSLLIAAASIVSMVPAMAADVKTIDSEEGTIYNAEVDTNGAYIGGEINGVDAAYYESNGEFTVLDDIDSGDNYTSHKGHVMFNDGDYTLDLSTGTVTDDDYWADHIDEAAEAIWKNIKDDTDDRYDEDDTKDMRTYDDDNIRSLGGAGDWYQTTYTNVDDDCTNVDKMDTVTVYSDQDGNFLDGDYNLGKIKVTTTDSAGKAYDTTIDNTNDAFDVDDDSTISAYVTNQNVIDMDKEYFYRTATVTINTTAEGITKINGKAIDGTAFDIESDTSVSFNVVQKISKTASSDTIHGVPYADSVTTYVISDKNGDNDSDDYDVIKDSSAQARVAAGGKVREFYTDASSDSDNVVVRTYTLKGSNGFYYLDAEDTSTSKEDAEVDGDGNIAFVKNGSDLYRLDGGYIYKYNDSDDGDWDKLYKVDGSFDDFVVNSDTNMIAWSEDDEVYSIIFENASSEDTTTATDTTSENTNVATQAVTTGWDKAADGTWTYVKADGTKATGWLQDGAAWYYLKADGVMATGWVNDNGTWYYCNTSGAMLVDTTVDGYVLGTDGGWSLLSE